MFFEHCCSLPFNGKPDYNHFCHLFDNLLVKEEGLQGDMVFDWDVAGTKILEQDFKIMHDVPLHEYKPSFKHHMV